MSFKESMNINNENNGKNGNINDGLDTILLQLIEMGYDNKYSKRVVYYFHPDDLEEALNYMEIENGIIQHRFIRDNKDVYNKSCFICGENEDIHLKELNFIHPNNNINRNINTEFKNNNDKNLYNDTTNMDHSSFNLKNDINIEDIIQENIYDKNINEISNRKNKEGLNEVDTKESNTFNLKNFPEDINNNINNENKINLKREKEINTLLNTNNMNNNDIINNIKISNSFKNPMNVKEKENEKQTIYTNLDNNIINILKPLYTIESTTEREDFHNIENIFKEEEEKIENRKKMMCPVCNDEFVADEKNKVKNCGHAFCNSCWYNYLYFLINTNNLSKIKCLNYKCPCKLTEEFIINLLNSNNTLIKKYKRYQSEVEIINNPNKKLCPFPNCDSYLEIKNKNEYYVGCKNNHFYCFECLKKPHGKLPCKVNLDKSVLEYASKYFVKKCPNCSIIVEKKGGCNHIICAKCHYQWCWLCNNKYENDHFDKGKCKGFKFFNPKNEYEIKQVMKGKMNYKKLSKSERQYDNDDKNINIVATKLSNNFVTFSTIDHSSYKNEDNFIHVHSFHMSDKILFIINFIFFRNCINRNLEILNPFIIYGYLLLNITLFFQLIFINMISFLLITKKQGLNKIMLIEKNKRKLNKKLIIISFSFIVICYLPLFIIINFFI